MLSAQVVSCFRVKIKKHPLRASRLVLYPLLYIINVNLSVVSSCIHSFSQPYLVDPTLPRFGTLEQPHIAMIARRTGELRMQFLLSLDPLKTKSNSDMSSP